MDSKNNARKKINHLASRPYRVGNVLVIGGLTYIVSECNKSPKETKFKLVLILDETKAA